MPLTRITRYVTVKLALSLAYEFLFKDNSHVCIRNNRIYLDLDMLRCLLQHYFCSHEIVFIQADTSEWQSFEIKADYLSCSFWFANNSINDLPIFSHLNFKKLIEQSLEENSMSLYEHPLSTQDLSRYTICELD